MGLESLATKKVDFTGEDRKRKKKLWVLAGVALFLVLGAGGAAAWMLLGPKNAVDDVPVTVDNTEAVVPAEIPLPEAPKVILSRSYLTGEMIAPEVAVLRPIAVSIENHSSSRPPTGLIYADIVYEMPVEAGITRYLAIYQQNQPEKVGPERSARVYMLEWVKEYDAIFAHIGQDPKVLTLIGPYGVDDLRDTGAWWDPESTGRSREHRAYTSILVLREAANEKGWGLKDSFDSWSFLDKESDPADRPVSQTVSIDYSSAAYLTEWSYNVGENAYMRWDGGEVHVDAATDTQIMAKNVIIEYVSVWLRSGDDKGRRDMTVVGSGDLVVFRDGQAVTGTWRKDSRESRTQLLDAAGNTISLLPGKTWVQIVPALENMVNYDTQVAPGPVDDAASSVIPVEQ